MTIGLSIWVLVDSPSFAHFLDVIHVDDVPVYRTGAALLLAVACVVFLLTLFGCVGASRESKCMLGTVRSPSLGFSTGLGLKVVPRLRECCRLSLADVISNSSTK